MSKIYITATDKLLKSIIPENASTETTELNKLSIEQLTTLSNKSGIDITSDAALSEAKKIITDNLTQISNDIKSMITGIIPEEITNIVDEIDELASDKQAITTGTELLSYQTIAQSLCNGISFDDLGLDILNSKVEFEDLLDWVLGANDADFLSKLSVCSLFDTTSTSKVQKSIPSSVASGNVAMLETTLTIIDPNTISNKTDIATSIATNMDNTSSNVTSMNNVLSSFDITNTDLVQFDTLGTTAIDINSVNNLSTNGTLFVDDIIGSDTRKIVSAVNTIL